MVLEEEKRELEVTNERLLRNFADVQAAVTVERERSTRACRDNASVKEALEVVASSYPGALVVLPEALNAAEQTRYRLVARASAAFDAIGQVAVAWREGNLGVGFRDAFAELGFDYRLVSEITQGRHRSDYERTYDGHRILLGPHRALAMAGLIQTIRASTGSSTRTPTASSSATPAAICRTRRPDSSAGTKAGCCPIHEDTGPHLSSPTPPRPSSPR